MSTRTITSDQRPESRVELAARLLIHALDRTCPEWRKDMSLFGDEPSAIDHAWVELLAAVDAVTEAGTRAPVFAFEESDPRVLIEGRLPGTQGLWIVFGKEAVGLMPDGFEAGLCLSYPASIEVGRILWTGDLAAGRREDEDEGSGEKLGGAPMPLADA